MAIDERTALCWLGMDKALDLRCKHRLLAYFGSAAKVYQAEIGSLLESGILEPCQARDLIHSRNADVENGLKELRKKDVEVVCLSDGFYPIHLRHIFFPPLLLYYKGICNREGFEKTLAVVGSRRASLSGKQNTRNMVRALSSEGITIVSGMAVGIDTQAHLACLDDGGKTAAILGCGIDRCYPKENQDLMDSIVDQGGVVFSEFPPGTPPLPQNFPMRNRIISGMSLGVLVAEAERKSGSLITARFAAEQGREVYAFPGELHRKNAVGTNRLIKDGAKMVLCPEDVLEDILPMFSKKI